MGPRLGVVSEAFQDSDFAALMKHADMSAADKRALQVRFWARCKPMVRNLVDLLVSKGSVDSIRASIQVTLSYWISI
ncbi:MAG: hypothetical protein Ct9H300mP11_23210 [Chloroflexota bacterium]|nr:MAG: hypothetical protein Ct9H300mP11_23210 [Chloroflexota bacterium]